MCWTGVEERPCVVPFWTSGSKEAWNDGNLSTYLAISGLLCLELCIRYPCVKSSCYSIMPEIQEQLTNGASIVVYQILQCD